MVYNYFTNYNCTVHVVMYVHCCYTTCTCMYDNVPYKMIYWWEINIGDWRFYEETANIKSVILFQSEHAQWLLQRAHCTSCYLYFWFFLFIKFVVLFRCWLCHYLFLLSAILQCCLLLSHFH